MLRFATVDAQPGSDLVAVWLTSCGGPTGATHVNAVVIDTANDPEALVKFRALTRDAVVLATSGSDLTGLPFEGKPLTTDDLADLLNATEAQQDRIVAAVDGYAVRPDQKSGKVPTSPRKIVRPTFLPWPKPDAFLPADDSPAQRALATANYLVAAWNVWLSTEQERLQRTVSQKGETPWMMPEELNSPIIAPLPEKFAERLNVQPLV